MTPPGGLFAGSALRGNRYPKANAEPEPAALFDVHETSFNGGETRRRQRRVRRDLNDVFELTNFRIDFGGRDRSETVYSLRSGQRSLGQYKSNRH